MDLTIMDNYDLLVMKMIHYFIVKENYSPIIIKGIEDEIWLENKNNEYSFNNNKFNSWSCISYTW